MNVHKIETPGFPPTFHEILGQFHGLWLMFDVHVDYSIGHFLKIGFDQTHLLVSGTEFGRKLRFLVELLKRSDHPKKGILIESVRKLQSSKRDIITHSYIKSNNTNITFMYRSRGDYQSGELKFHINEFGNHVGEMVLATQRYQNAFGASLDDLTAFAKAVLNMKKS
jgi:hypothetical protein